MNTPEPTLIKKKELAKRLSVSTRSIDTWVGKRMIPYIQITPRFYLYEFDAVLAALKMHYQVEIASLSGSTQQQRCDCLEASIG